MASLYDRPDLYDLVAPRDETMERFYVDAAQAGGRRVLELACGTGRLAVPLAEAGLEVVGADLSEAMLERAHEAAATRSVSLELVRADMRDFDLGRSFDTVIVAANSIAHLTAPEDLRGLFASAARHLRPGGQLLFDTFVPSVSMLASDGKRLPIVTATHPELGAVKVEETIAYDPIAQISQVEWFWSARGQPDFWRTPLTLRQIFPQELPLLVAAGGFVLKERFGGFDRSAFTSGSWQQVCVCVPHPP